MDEDPKEQVMSLLDDLARNMPEADYVELLDELNVEIEVRLMNLSGE